MITRMDRGSACDGIIDLQVVSIRRSQHRARVERWFVCSLDSRYRRPWLCGGLVDVDVVAGAGFV